ncbi:MAG: hypothetical protein ACP5NF_10990 [Thermoanaerobaculum sp.]
MKRVFLTFLAFGAWAALAAQPCRVERVAFDPWPVDLPRPPEGWVGSEGGLGSGIYVRYLGGKYFLHVNPAPSTVLPPEHPAAVSALAVSDTMGNFRVVPAPPGYPEFPKKINNRRRLWYGGGRFLAFYDADVEGVYDSVSTDGVRWSVPVRLWWIEYQPGVEEYEIYWDGEFYIAYGFLYGLFASQNLVDWTYLGPLVESRHSAILWDGKRLVANICTSRSCGMGITEDFENWQYAEDPSLISVDPFFVANGWYWSGVVEPYPFLGRSRDGLHWERFDHDKVAQPYNPGYCYPKPIGEQMVCAGLFHHLGAPPVAHMIRVRPEGASLSELFTIEDTADEHGPFDTLSSFLLNAVWSWDGKTLWLSTHPVHDFFPEKVYLSDFRLYAIRCPDLGDPTVFPGVASAPGAEGSLWRTSLSLSYPGVSEAEVLVQWLPFGGPHEHPREVLLRLDAGESREYRDAVRELFGGSGAGSLRVVMVSGTPVVAAVRTYNDTGQGTMGQEIPGWRWEEGVGPGEDAMLVGLEESGDLRSGYRTNVGVQNLWSEAVEVEVRFFAGRQEILKLTKVLGPFEGVQWFRPLAGRGPVEKAYAVVRIVRGNDSRVAVWASKVDNRTGDPTTIKARKLPFQGRPFEHPCPQGCPPVGQ